MNARTLIVKVCGITSVADALLCVEAGADMLGLILAESPRRVDPAVARIIADEVGGRAELVGVFAQPQELIDYAKKGLRPLDYYQVYFDPIPEVSLPPTKGWIRAHWITDQTRSVTAFDSAYTLYDFKNSSHDRMAELLDPVRDSDRAQLILAGNLDHTNVGKLIARHKPCGVDVARGTERKPGHKDPELVKRFVHEAKHAAD